MKYMAILLKLSGDKTLKVHSIEENVYFSKCWPFSCWHILKFHKQSQNMTFSDKLRQVRGVDCGASYDRRRAVAFCVYVNEKYRNPPHNNICNTK